MDLVKQAREFAVNAHKRIDHRRKYTQQPYSNHLAAVAQLVSSVTSDAETIAAAWLHDVVEDTEATLFDVEREFGKAIAALVEDLTDISKPSDGNREVRKAMDRAHLADAELRAKTVKLADLIDNCKDICSNDPRFARVYLAEMSLLLEVLEEGDSVLYEKAQQVHDKCSQALERSANQTSDETLAGTLLSQRLQGKNHLLRMFSEAFTAQDIAEPLRSFDADKPCAEVRAAMKADHLDIVGVRQNGRIEGYVRLTDLTDGNCGRHVRPFRSGQALPGDSSFSDVIHILTLNQYGFITLLGEVIGFLSRNDINKPVVRMWLFGIINFVEMEITQMIHERYPDDAWQSLLSEGRLKKAQELQAERQRREQHGGLLDCLQLSDKGQILITNPAVLTALGFDSKRTGKRIIRELESLRNNLAHAQDIVTHDWAQIVRLSYRLEESFSIRQDAGIERA